ncbi:MAG: DUF3617 domain-containing protein [Sphingomicrobium sp.]
MIARLMMVGLSMVALAACNKPAVDERNASVADVAKAVGKAQASEMKFQPGRWESSFTIESMEVPGMPAGAAKAAVGNKTHYATCLTQEKAAKPGSDFFAKDSKNCTYDLFTMGGGTIDAKMHCGNAGGSAVVTMKGNYSPTHYAMKMESVTNAERRGPLTMRMAIEANHAGQCKGNEDGRG